MPNTRQLEVNRAVPELVAAAAKGGKPQKPADIPAVFDQFYGAISSDLVGEQSQYEDGVDLVKADIESDGRAWLQTFAGNPRKEAIERRLCVDLSNPIGEPESPDDWLGFETAAAVDLTTELLCLAATLHTRNHSNGDKMLDMTVGETAYAGGKIALTELASSGRNSWEWRLIFDTYPMDPDGALGVCITRLDDVIEPDGRERRSWRLFNGCSALRVDIDDTVELWRFVGKGDPVQVADLSMPFQLVATEL